MPYNDYMPVLYNTDDYNFIFGQILIILPFAFLKENLSASSDYCKFDLNPEKVSPTIMIFIDCTETFLFNMMA